jgi:hypothetical protein
VRRNVSVAGAREAILQIIERLGFAHLLNREGVGNLLDNDTCEAVELGVVDGLDLSIAEEILQVPGHHFQCHGSPPCHESVAAARCDAAFTMAAATSAPRGIRNSGAFTRLDWWNCNPLLNTVRFASFAYGISTVFREPR